MTDAVGTRVETFHERYIGGGGRPMLMTVMAATGCVLLIGLLLSSVGLYAVMASAVTARTQEIGVRLALGAQRRQVRWLILRRGVAQLAIGTTLGLAGSLLLRRMLPAGIEGISSHDPIALAGIMLLLSVVGVVACLGPAQRATRVDPIVTLRD